MKTCSLIPDIVAVAYCQQIKCATLSFFGQQGREYKLILWELMFGSCVLKTTPLINSFITFSRHLTHKYCSHYKECFSNAV